MKFRYHEFSGVKVKLLQNFNSDVGLDVNFQGMSHLVVLIIRNVTFTPIICTNFSKQIVINIGGRVAGTGLC
jgi:hypothetical protein